MHAAPSRIATPSRSLAFLLAALALAVPAVGQSVFEEPHYATSRSYAEVDPHGLVTMGDHKRAEPNARVVTASTGEGGVQPSSGWSSRRQENGWMWYNEIPGENGTAGDAGRPGEYTGIVAEHLYPWLPRPDGTLQPATNNCISRLRSHMSGQVQVMDQPSWCGVVRSWLVSPLTPVTPEAKTLSFTWRKPGSEFSQYPAIGVNTIQSVLDWLSQELGGEQGSWVPRTDNKLLVYVTTDPTGRSGWQEIERIRYYDGFPSNTSDKKFNLQYDLSGLMGQTVRVAFVYEWRPPGSWSPAPNGGWTGHWRSRMRDWQKYYDDAPKLDNINAAIPGWPAGDFPNLLRAYQPGRAFADSVLYENFSHEGIAHGGHAFTSVSRSYFGSEAQHRFPGEGWRNGGMWELMRLPSGEAIAASKTSGVYNDRALRTPFLRPSAPYDTLQFRVGHMGGAGVSANVYAEIFDESGGFVEDVLIYSAGAGQGANVGVDPSAGRLGLGLVQIGLHEAGGRDLRGRLIRIAFYPGLETGSLLIDNVGGIPRATPPGHVPDFAGKMLAPDVQVFSRQGDLEFIEGGKAPLSAVLLPYRGYTVEAWVRLGASERTRTLFHSDQVELRVDAGGSLRLSQNGTVAQSAGGAVPANRWAHVAATFTPYSGSDGSKGRIAVLVDGQEVGAADNAAAISSSGPVRLLDGPNGIFREAAVDELRIWSVGKTPQQIVAAQSRAVSSQAPRLRARFSFDASTTEGGSIVDETRGFRLRLSDDVWGLDQTFSSAPLRDGLVDVTEETSTGPQERHAVVIPRSNLAGTNPVTLFTDGDFEGAFVTNSQEDMPGGVGSRIPVIFQVAYTSTGGMAPPILRLYYGGWNIESPSVLSRHLPGNDPDWRDMGTMEDYITHNTAERYFEIDLDRGDAYREFTIGTPIKTDYAAWMEPVGYDEGLIAHGAANSGIRFDNLVCTMDRAALAAGKVCARARVQQVGAQEAEGRVRVRHGAHSANYDYDGAHPDGRVSPTEYLVYGVTNGPGTDGGAGMQVSLGGGARELYEITGTLEGIYAYVYDPAYCDTSGNNCERRISVPDIDPTNDEVTGGVFIHRGPSEKSAYFDGSQKSGFALQGTVRDYVAASNPALSVWTMEAWVKLDPEGDVDAWQPILGTPAGGFALGVEGRRFVMKSNRGGAACEVTGGTGLTPGRWHHVQVSAGADNTWLWQDGRAVAGGCGGVLALPAATLDGPLLVARDGDARLRGSLDEVLVFASTVGRLGTRETLEPQYLTDWSVKNELVGSNGGPDDYDAFKSLTAFLRFEGGFEDWAVDFSYWQRPGRLHEGALEWRDNAPQLFTSFETIPYQSDYGGVGIPYYGFSIQRIVAEGPRIDGTVYGAVEPPVKELIGREALPEGELPPGFRARSTSFGYRLFALNGGAVVVGMGVDTHLPFEGTPRLLRRRSLHESWEDITGTAGVSRNHAAQWRMEHRVSASDQWRPLEYYALGDYVTTDLELTARYAGAEGESGVVELVLTNAGARDAELVDVALETALWTERSIPLAFDREVARVDTTSAQPSAFYQTATRGARYRWHVPALASGASDTLRVRYPLAFSSGGEDQLLFTQPLLAAAIELSGTGDTDATPGLAIAPTPNGNFDLTSITEDDELYLYLPRHLDGRYRVARTFDGQDDALVFVKDAQAGTHRATLSQPMTAGELGLRDASFTAEVWVKPSATDGTRTIFGQNDDGTGGGTLHLAVRLGRAWMGFGAANTDGARAIPTDEWTHLAFVYDKEKQEQRIYVNGVLDAVGTARGPLMSDAPVYLGQSFGGFRFAGAMTGVRIWERARSGGEIRAAMHARLFDAEGLRVALAEDWDILDDGQVTFWNPEDAALPSLTGVGHVARHEGGTEATGDDLLAMVGRYASAGTGGTARPSGDFSATYTGGQSGERLHAGSYGDASAQVGAEGGIFAGPIAHRSARVFTVAAGSGEAELTIRYEGLTAIDASKARLLYRAPGSGQWSDVTSLAAHDAEAKLFLLATTRFGDYAVGQAAGGAGADNALVLDGSDDYAQTSAPVDLSGDFSIAFWAKAAPGGGVDCYVGQGTAEQNRGLHVCWLGDWTMRFDFHGDALDVPAEGTYDWYHWAFTYDRASGERIIYRNGEELGRGVAAAPYAGSGPLTIGTGGPVGQPAKGQMDDVRIFDRVLTPREVQHYGLNHPEPFTEGLVADWRFDEAGGNTVADYAGGHTLTLQGGAARTPSTSPRPRGGVQRFVAAGAQSAPVMLGTGSAQAQVFAVQQPGTDAWASLSGTPDALVTGEAFPARVTGRSSLVWTVTQRQSGTFTLDGSLRQATGGFRPGRQRVPLYRPFPGAPWQNVGASVASYRDGGASFVMQSAQPGQYAVGEQLGLSITPGDALALGGSGYAEGAYSATLNPAQFTAEAWVRMDGGSGHRHIISSRSAPNDGYLIFLDELNRPVFWLGDGTNAAHLVGAALAPARWTHLAASYDGTTMRLYVDGIEVGVQAAGYAANASRPFRLGADSWADPSAHFVGLVEEVRLWNEARSLAQIRGDMHRLLLGTEASLAAYYRFEGIEGEYRDAVDYAGSNPLALAGDATVLPSEAPLMLSPFYADASRRTARAGGQDARFDVALPETATPQQRVQVYAFGSPDSTVAKQHEALPEGVQARSHFVWGVEGFEGAAPEVTIGYETQGYSPLDARLVYREAYGAPWQDASADFARDTVNRVFTASQLARFGQYAIADVAQAADLRVRVLGTDTLRVGQPLTRRVVVTNHGPASAVAHVIVEGEGFAAGTPERGVFHSESNRWNVGRMFPGQTATLTLAATPSRDSALTLRATATVALGPDDPNAGNSARSLVAAPLDAKGNRALAFDGGSEQSVRVGQHAALDLTGPMTVAFWFKTSDASLYQHLVSKGTSGVDNYETAIHEGKLYSRWHIGGQLVNPYGQTALESNRWYHAAYVYDGAHLVLYLDGVEDGRAEATGAVATGGILALGQEPFHSSYLRGALDEVAILGRALTPEQVREQMVRRTPVDMDGLVALYRFDEPSGTRVYDVAGGHHATLAEADAETRRVRSGAKFGADAKLAATADQPEEVGTTGTTGSGVVLTPKVTGGGFFALYLSGRADSLVTPGAGEGTEETFPARTRKRVARIWGITPSGAAEGSAPSADVTFHYGGLDGVSDFERVRVLRRASPNDPWEDVTDQFTHDEASKTFTALGKSSFSEYTLGDVGIAPTRLRLTLTAALEGALDVGSGQTHARLAQRGLLPTSHPFAGAPYDVPASGIDATDADASGVPDFFETGAGSTAVDYVLVEVRSGDPSGTMTTQGRAPALLHGDGRVSALDGGVLDIAQLHGEPFAQDALYVVLYHRNHLPAMGAAATRFAVGRDAPAGTPGGYGAGTLDLRSVASYGGGTASVSAGGGSVFVLRSGNAVLGDGTDERVQASDRSAWELAFAAGVRGYAPADYDLNGRVSPRDRALWEAAFTAGARSTVPAAGLALPSAPSSAAPSDGPPAPPSDASPALDAPEPTGRDARDGREGERERTRTDEKQQQREGDPGK